MGLDFSHCKAHWSYGGFDFFRSRLAKEIGIDWAHVCTMDTCPIKKAKDDLKKFLLHSDCEGTLGPKTCLRTATRIRELVSGWPDDYDKKMALELCSGMEKAAKRGESLEFC